MAVSSENGKDLGKFSDYRRLSHLLIPQVLGHQVPEQLLPDVAQVGELADTLELSKLLQLVLGCAISCERKQGIHDRRKSGAVCHTCFRYMGIRHCYVEAPLVEVLVCPADRNKLALPFARSSYLS